MELRRKWIAVDADGNIVQTMEIEWPNGHPDPDGAMNEVKAEIEGKGLTFVLLDDNVALPTAGVHRFSKGKFIKAPVPVGNKRRRDEISRLTAKARATLDSSTAKDSEKMEAATFLRNMGEL